MSGRYLTASAARELADRLTEPDWLVVEQVSKLRFVSGGQLTRLCFGLTDDRAVNARAARRALLRLTRFGLLARLPRVVGGVRAGSAGYVYCLGLGGHRLAVTRGWQPERIRRRSAVPGTMFLHHSLLIAELHARLVEAERSGSFELLELTAEPSCWRSMDGLSAQRLKPDSYVRLATRDNEYSYFIEVDRGTEGAQTIVRQLGVYSTYYQAGTEQASREVFPRVLWLSTTAKRVQALQDCVERLPAVERQLFQVAPFDCAIAAMTAPDQ
jgi:Replication-relaxation